MEFIKLKYRLILRHFLCVWMKIKIKLIDFVEFLLSRIYIDIRIS